RVSGLRWPVETALEEGKGEVGMDHYETRTWLGWHHQMIQSFMAHLFLIRLCLVFQKKFLHLQQPKLGSSWPQPLPRKLDHLKTPWPRSTIINGETMPPIALIANRLKRNFTNAQKGVSSQNVVVM